MSEQTYRPPAYLLRNIEQQQQALAIVQVQVQSALNLAGEWLAEELGISLEEVIASYRWDGKAFRAKQAASSGSAPA